MNVFKAESADLAWRMAADQIVHQHGTEVVSSRNGQAIDLLHASVTVTNARARWVASRMPAMNIALVIAEVAQIVAGGDDVHFLEHWFSRYGQFVGSRDKAAGAYGARLRVRWGFDQIARAAESLAAIGESRQIVLSIWDPRADLPEDNGQPRSGDVPCNVLSCLRLINGRLHWLQTARSNDLFRGLPNNIVQFSCLQEIIAGWIGAEVGQYTHAISSLHAYVKSLSEFRIDPELPAVVESSDIRLPRSDAEAAWDNLYRLARELVDHTQDRPMLPLLTTAGDLGPLEHMYWILVAEHARKRGWRAESEEAAHRCADRALSTMWHRWIHRIDLAHANS